MPVGRLAAKPAIAMPSITSHWSPDTLQHAAGQLSRAAAEGALPQPLRGKRLALLSDDHTSPAATVFVRAATELGAHVALVRAASASGPRGVAALLGQLYDAIECQGLDEADLQELAREAGVPVFNGIGSAAHPLFAQAGPQDHHRMLQAILCKALA